MFEIQCERTRENFIATLAYNFTCFIYFLNTNPALFLPRRTEHPFRNRATLDTVFHPLHVSSSDFPPNDGVTGDSIHGERDSVPMVQITMKIQS